jgi:putative peptidoglycan lipid II flippase
LQAVSLCQSCAQGFNPLGSPADESPNAGLAIDNDPSTSWDTQQYYSRQLEKAGVGIYLNASPGTVGRALRIMDSTPGFTATIYARNSVPPLRWPDPGWVKVSATEVIGTNTLVALQTGAQAYDYYLLWITSLGGHEQLSIAEMTLYR